MLWDKTGKAAWITDTSEGRTWRIDQLRTGERAFLTLLPAENSGLPLTPKGIRVAKCKSVAEAEVIATFLEHADDLDCRHPVDQMLLDAEFIDVNPLSESLASQIMENIWRNDIEGHRYVQGNRLWFGAPDDSWIAVDEHNHFPVYSFRLDLEGDQIVRPDSVLIQPKLWDGMAATPAAAFLFALEKIADRRMEAYGTHHTALAGNVHEALVERIESGEYRPVAASPAI